MQINDLDYLNAVDLPNQIEGAAFAFASSSSVATTGFAGSEFQAIAVGRSGSRTSALIRGTSVSIPRFSFNSASTSVFAYASDG